MNKVNESLFLILLVRRLEKPSSSARSCHFARIGRSGCCYVLYFKCHLQCKLLFMRSLRDAMNCVNRHVGRLIKLEHWDIDCANLQMYDVVSESHTQQTTGEKSDKRPISRHAIRQ